jgi:rSAM/selenodomain-associated transferase 2
MRLSLIVPTLNEELALERTLEHLASFSEEIIVSDGGSEDRTEEIARSFPVIWTQGPPGRGPQLNHGVASSSGEGLVFVHADTELPPNAATEIKQALDNGYAGGGFRVRFSGSHRLMAVGSRLVNLRTRITRAPLGDQAQFVRREVFDQLGGFHDWPIFEDLDFIRRLKKQAKITVLSSAVITSDRRYAQRGIGRTVALNWLIWSLYAVGVGPERLARFYRQVR